MSAKRDTDEADLPGGAMTHQQLAEAIEEIKALYARLEQTKVGTQEYNSIHASVGVIVRRCDSHAKATKCTTAERRAEAEAELATLQAQKASHDRMTSALQETRVYFHKMVASHPDVTFPPELISRINEDRGLPEVVTGKTKQALEEVQEILDRLVVEELWNKSGRPRASLS